MLIFLNGQFVPEDQALVSVFDRGFLYGDGLFETMLVLNGKPFRWQLHMERLRHGAEFLGIKSPFPPGLLRGYADQLVSRNQMAHSLLRLTLSRGVGARGYSPKGAEQPTLAMSLHPAPVRTTRPESRWKLVTSSFRLPAGELLAQFKTCNKLPQILARGEADAAGADEALLLNTEGFVVEGATSNLLWLEGDTVCTPPLADGILAGVTRAVVLEICGSLGLETRKDHVTPQQLKNSHGVFLSLSSWGVMQAGSLDGAPLRDSPLIEKLRLAYWDLVRAESA